MMTVRTVPMRREIQQAQHKVESALSVLMAGEDSCYAVDDLRSARDQLKQLEEALIKEMKNERVADSEGMLAAALLRLLAIYEGEIDRGDPPVAKPAWLIEAEHHARVLAEHQRKEGAPSLIEAQEKKAG